MQFGIFTVGDVTTDPTTGHTPSEHERIKATVAIAKHAEEVGLDVFAIGEHHNPPFIVVQPHHLPRRTSRAQTERHHPLDLDHADHHQRPGAHRRGLRDAAARRRRPRGPDARPRQHRSRCTRGSARTSARGIPLAIENYALLRRLWREDVVDWEGKFRTPLQGFTVDPAPAGRRRAVRVARLDPHAARSPSRRRTTATASSRTTSSGRRSTTSAAHRPLPPALRALRPRHARSRRSSASAARSSCASDSRRTRSRSSGPYFDNAPGLRPRPVAGGLHRA